MRIPRLALAAMFVVTAPIVSFAATPPAMHGHAAGHMIHTAGRTITAAVCRPEKGAFGTYVEAPPQEYGLAMPLTCQEAELAPAGHWSEPPMARRVDGPFHRTAALTRTTPLRAQY